MTKSHEKKDNNWHNKKWLAPAKRPLFLTASEQFDYVECIIITKTLFLKRTLWLKLTGNKSF